MQLTHRSISSFAISCAYYPCANVSHIFLALQVALDGINCCGAVPGLMLSIGIHYSSSALACSFAAPLMTIIPLDQPAAAVTETGVHFKLLICFHGPSQRTDERSTSCLGLRFSDHWPEWCGVTDRSIAGTWISEIVCGCWLAVKPADGGGAINVVQAGFSRFDCRIILNANIHG